MQYSVIENLLKEKIGLDPASIGSSSISRVIRRRLSESGYEDFDEYLKLLMSSEDELRALIEAIVIPETWFFRDGRPFMLLHDYVKEHWIKNDNSNQGMLRILSVPCSTGEEPYSIAMILKDIDYPSSRCQIDAVDVSSRAIAYARRGVYRENSFRGDEMNYRSRYFVKENIDYKLDPSICQMVNYFQGNLLDSGSLLAKGPYHVIFCRNLLIYFDRADQQRAITTLHKLLASDGILFIGHAEGSHILNGLFSRLKYQGAFAYKKSNDTDTLAVRWQERKYKFRENKTENTRTSYEADDKSTTGKYRPFNNNTIKQIIPLPDVSSGQLNYIRQLADEGRLTEASLLCEKYLQDFPDSATAYYLLGVLYDAVGDMKKASDMYRKAIYLEPNHHEALTHLSLHAERSGNKTVSDNLKRRALRAAQRQKSSMK